VVWFRKRPEAVEVERDLIEPTRLEVELDPALFRSHMTILVEAAQADGGVEGYLESLTAKHRLFAEALGEASLDALDEAALDALLETVFTARRKLHPVLAEFGLPKTVAALRELLHGNEALEGRIGAFVGALPIRAGEGIVDATAPSITRRSAAETPPCGLAQALKRSARSRST